VEALKLWWKSTMFKNHFFDLLFYQDSKSIFGRVSEHDAPAESGTGGGGGSSGYKNAQPISIVLRL
jgi:hypothetical protein